MKLMQIRTADADRPHLDDDLAESRSGFGNLAKFDGTRFGREVNDRDHGLTLR